MDLITFVKDWGAHIMSALGILGGLWAYFRHDRKLKIQGKKLNELQIRQIQKSEEKDLQANIKCYVNHGNKGNAIVKIVNAGPADATNVRVEIIDKDKLEGLIFYHDVWGPYDLINATNSVDERISLCCGYTEFIKLKIVWDDNYKKNRDTILNVQI